MTFSMRQLFMDLPLIDCIYLSHRMTPKHLTNSIEVHALEIEQQY